MELLQYSQLCVDLLKNNNDTSENKKFLLEKILLQFNLPQNELLDLFQNSNIKILNKNFVQILSNMDYFRITTLPQLIEKFHETNKCIPRKNIINNEIKLLPINLQKILTHNTCINSENYCQNFREAHENGHKYCVQNMVVMAFNFSSNFPYSGDIISFEAVVSFLGLSNIYQKYILTISELDYSDHANNICIQKYNSEQELLLGITKLIQNIDPDIITGWNICRYHFDDLYERAKIYGEKFSDEFLKLSKNNQKCNFNKKMLSNQCLGYNKYYYYCMHNRFVIDCFHIIRKCHILQSYYFNDVIQYLLNVEPKYFKYDDHTIFAIIDHIDNLVLVIILLRKMIFDDKIQLIFKNGTILC